jgi:3-oxoacyl-[acyl-carrier protein] reductase
MAVLAGRAAVVTGGSRGIGRGIVLRLCQDGAAVVFSYLRDEAAAKETEAASGGAASAVRADLGVLSEVRALFATAEERLGGLDIVVNNAGTAVPMSFADATEEEYDRVMDANAKGTFFAMQEAARRLRDGGRIVNLSSVNTVAAAPANAIYQGSKGAIEQFTLVGALELGPRGITVNTVSPGATDTDLLRSANPPEVLEKVPAMTPLGRLGQPADIAAVVAFLVGPDGAWVTGQNIRATGGIS